MEIVVTIAVRNPEWYWTEEELKEAGEDGRASWEMINEDKVEKHLPSHTFSFQFDVLEIIENRDAEVQLTLDANGKEFLSNTIKNVTTVKYVGDNKEAGVVISNSLIYQYIGAQKSGYKFYTYFYLKENTPYQNLNRLVWLSEEHYTLVQEQATKLIK